MKKPTIPVADELVKALIERGVVPGNCRRVVMDLVAGEPGVIYFECLGDNRLLEVFQDPSIRIIKDFD